MSLPSQGTALILAALLGVFGADKFYLGLTGQGIAMIILTFTLIGLLVTIPWAYLSCLFLVISILWNSKQPMLYPSTIKWAPLTKTDKIIAWIVVGIAVLGMIFPIVYKSETSSSSVTTKTEEEATLPPSSTTGPPSSTTGPPSVTTGPPSVTTGPPSVTTRPPSVTTGPPSSTTPPGV